MRNVRQSHDGVFFRWHFLRKTSSAQLFLRTLLWLFIAVAFSIFLGFGSFLDLRSSYGKNPEPLDNPSVWTAKPKVEHLDTKEEQWYIVSSFTRPYADKDFAKRTPEQLYGSLPLTLTFRECYAREHPHYHLVYDTNDYTETEMMPQTVRGPNPNKNFPIPIQPWSEVWNKSYTEEYVRMPPHWNKVFSLLNLFEDKGLTGDWMVWMDGDMHFFNFKPMEDFKFPKSVSLVMFPLSDYIFWVRMDEFGKSFLQTWIDLAQGRKVICEHRFGFPEYHDLYWFWATSYYTFDTMYYNGVSTNNCSDFRPFQEKWTEQQVTIMKKEGKRLPRIQYGRWNGIVFQNIIILNRNIHENWEFGRKSQFADMDSVFAIHSKHPFEGWHLRSECNRFRIRECVEKYRCGAVILDENQHPIVDVTSRQTFTGTTLFGGCDFDSDTDYLYKLQLPSLIYGSSERGSGCKEPGCDCWKCSCAEFYHADRTNLPSALINDFGNHFGCDRDYGVADSWVQLSKSIHLANPVHVKDPCVALQLEDEHILQHFLFNQSYVG